MIVMLGSIIPHIPLDQWVNNFVDWATIALAGVFTILKTVIGVLTGTLDSVLSGPPDVVMAGILAAIAWYLASWGVALFTAAGSVLIISLGLWQASMDTLSLVLAAALVSLILGISLGVAAAQSRTVEAIVRPNLDVMQTMPAFVYLIPLATLLGLGNPPALIATIIFAMPPAVRLTLLGIKQVPTETVEAAYAFGATPWQTLIKVELPLALPSIMAGINQVILLSLSMVVIAALIGSGGLGTTVVTGLSQANPGQGFIGGVCIVILAVMLDRITRNLRRRRLPRTLTARLGGRARATEAVAPREALPS